MHWHDKPCTFSDQRLDHTGFDHQGITINIDENRRGPPRHDEIDGGDPGHGGGDDLVARPDIQRMQQQVHTGGGRGECHSVGAAGRLAKTLFQFGGLGSGSDPAGAQHLVHRPDVGLGDGWPRKRQEGIGQCMPRYGVRQGAEPLPVAPD